MLTFFPTPYKDELLYSILARHHFYSGNDDITTTIKELFSCKKITAVIDLPCNLYELINNMNSSWNYNIDNLVIKYTLFPFYKPFWPHIRVDEVLKNMESKTSRFVHLKAGVCSGDISYWKYIRFCPQCFEEDIKTYGEAYWHRIHQIPSVIVCPVHKIAIYNSTIRTYEVNQKYFYSANSENCKFDIQAFKYDKKILNKAVSLASDIEWILNSNIPEIGPKELSRRYIYLLRERGWVSQKGRVNQNRLISSFVEYQSQEFLDCLGLMPEINKPHNWVAMLTRKCDYVPHPVKHILMIKFLAGSVKEFFSSSYNNKPFGVGPYPCLNAAADHYKKNIINNALISYSRNKNIFGTFSCSCGFTYTRKGPDKDDSDKYRYSNILNYGHEWEERLIELIQNQKLHLREVARILKVDLTTVRRYVARLNLKTEWMSQESKNRLNSSSNEIKVKQHRCRSKKSI